MCVYAYAIEYAWDRRAAPRRAGVFRVEAWRGLTVLRLRSILCSATSEWRSAPGERRAAGRIRERQRAVQRGEERGALHCTDLYIVLSCTRMYVYVTACTIRSRRVEFS